MFGVKYNLILLVKDLLGGGGGVVVVIVPDWHRSRLTGITLFGADEICRAERRKAGMTI